MDINKDEYEYTYDDYIFNCESNKGKYFSGYKKLYVLILFKKTHNNNNIENIKKLKLH